MACSGHEEILEYLKKHRSYYLFQNSAFIYAYILSSVLLHHGMDHSPTEQQQTGENQSVGCSR